MRPKSPERPLVYLACPYSDADPVVRKSRFDAANETTVYLIQRDKANVFSPITHSHPLHLLGLDGGWNFWEKIDREYLAVSHKLVVLMMPGWSKSVGVTSEIKIACEQGLEIEYLDPAKVSGFFFADRRQKIIKKTNEPLPSGPAPETLNPVNRPLKDSGTRKEFSGGAVRDTAEGKGRYDLLSPHSIFRIANIFEKGAKKYAARNWEKGMNLSRLVDSALRHTFQYLEGHRDEDHLAQAAWNLMAALHTEEMIRRGVLPESFNDLPNHLKAKSEAKTSSIDGCCGGEEVPF